MHSERDENVHLIEASCDFIEAIVDLLDLLATAVESQPDLIAAGGSAGEHLEEAAKEARAIQGILMQTKHGGLNVITAKRADHPFDDLDIPSVRYPRGDLLN